MRKLPAFIIALCIAVCCFSACGKTENTPDGEQVSLSASVKVKEQTLPLGTSGLTLTSGKYFGASDITSEEAADNKTASYFCGQTAVAIDVYEWDKADGDTLSAAAKAAAADYNAKVTETEINGFPAAYFSADAVIDGTSYSTVTYVIETQKCFAGITFLTADGDVRETADTLIGTLAEAKAPVYDTIYLGTTFLCLSPEHKYTKGEITADDIKANKVAYYHGEGTGVDFDVYQREKEDGETLSSAVNAEAEKYGAAPKNMQINGINVSCFSTENGQSVYMLSSDGFLLTVVFRLNGENAAAEVQTVMSTLSK